jgi:D-alanine-D-alanine ligase
VSLRRVLVLHSDIAPDAPPDEQDTLVQAEAVANALAAQGIETAKAAFTRDPDALKARIGDADVIFNLVESIDGSGRLSALAPGLFESLGAIYTGAGETELAATCDKPLTKRMLRDAGLPTPDWSDPPAWEGLRDDVPYIVKSAIEDASVGLDDDSVVTGGDKVKARAEESLKKFGGRWFAERYVDGREFNIAVLQGAEGPHVLPLAEMTFEEWQKGRPKIVGYTAKWDDDSFESTRTVRVFGLEQREPELANALSGIARRVWNLLGLTGYARVDFRVDASGAPTVLEINPNPCLAPDAGFAAAAAQAGLSYEQLVLHIVRTALGEHG